LLQALLDPIILGGVTFDERDAQTEVKVSGANVRLNPRIEDRHEQPWNDAADQDHMMRREANALEEAGRLVDDTFCL